MHEDRERRGHGGRVHINEAEVCGRGSQAPHWSLSWRPQIFIATPITPTHSSVEDEWEMELFVPRGPLWNHYTGTVRASESNTHLMRIYKPSVVATVLFCGKGSPSQVQ